jgi:DNA polymerase II large subunit
MPAVRTVGMLFIALAAGCAGVEEAPYSESPSASKAAVPVKMSKKNSASPKNLEPPLDVAALKTRLRETHAIGVFTKLALKNQMDDLLEQFRAHYQNGQKTSVASLRQPYDMLVLKVLSLVQDGDPSLARTISGSREAIWAILADKEKFNSVT